MDERGLCSRATTILVKLATKLFCIYKSGICLPAAFTCQLLPSYILLETMQILLHYHIIFNSQIQLVTPFLNPPPVSNFDFNKCSVDLCLVCLMLWNEFHEKTKWWSPPIDDFHEKTNAHKQHVNIIQKLTYIFIIRTISGDYFFFVASNMAVQCYPKVL